MIKNNVPTSDAICESEHGSGTERRRRGVSIPCSASERRSERSERRIERFANCF